MPKYGANATDFTTPTGTADTAILLMPDAAGEAAEVIELVMTGSGVTAPADVQHQAAAMFSDGTTGGTGTAQTPVQFDKGAAAAELAVTIEHTAEPTVLGTVFPVLFGFNQRGGLRWAVPRGEGVKIDNAETDEDLAWTVVSSTAGKIDAMVNWWEHQ